MGSGWGGDKSAFSRSEQVRTVPMSRKTLQWSIITSVERRTLGNRSRFIYLPNDGNIWIELLMMNYRWSSIHRQRIPKKIFISLIVPLSDVRFLFIDLFATIVIQKRSLNWPLIPSDCRSHHASQTKSFDLPMEEWYMTLNGNVIRSMSIDLFTYVDIINHQSLMRRKKISSNKRINVNWNWNNKINIRRRTRRENSSSPSSSSFFLFLIDDWSNQYFNQMKVKYFDVIELSSIQSD